MLPNICIICQFLRKEKDCTIPADLMIRVRKDLNDRVKQET